MHHGNCVLSRISCTTEDDGRVILVVKLRTGEYKKKRKRFFSYNVCENIKQYFQRQNIIIKMGYKGVERSKDKKKKKKKKKKTREGQTVQNIQHGIHTAS